MPAPAGTWSTTSGTIDPGPTALKPPFSTGILALALPILAACDGAESESAPVWFTDVTPGSGIVLQNVSGNPDRKTHLVETLGSGAAALDFDEDGWLDLFVVNGDALPGTTPVAEPRPALYRNLGGMRFAGQRP